MLSNETNRTPRHVRLKARRKPLRVYETTAGFMCVRAERDEEWCVNAQNSFIQKV